MTLWAQKRTFGAEAQNSPKPPLAIRALARKELAANRCSSWVSGPVGWKCPDLGLLNHNWQGLTDDLRLRGIVDHRHRHAVGTSCFRGSGQGAVLMQSQPGRHSRAH